VEFDPSFAGILFEVRGDVSEFQSHTSVLLWL
jgi:hypothetical protein